MKILERLNPKNTVTLSRPIAHALGLNTAVVYSALISKQIYYEQHDMLDEDGFFNNRRFGKKHLAFQAASKWSDQCFNRVRFDRVLQARYACQTVL